MGKTLPSGLPPLRYVVELPTPPPKELKYSCHCGKQFAKPSRLRMHEVLHLPEKPYKCDFEGCDSSYYRLNHLKRHEATRHSKVGGDYKCEFDGCFASFDSWQSLYFHNKRKHSERKHKCTSCSEMFMKKFQLKEHEYQHTGVAPFVCKAKGCSETFISHGLLKSHNKTHQNGVEAEGKAEGKSYHCQECDSVFEKWSAFLAHRKVSHVFVNCFSCDKTVLKSQLRHHVKLHEDNKEVFPCPREGCKRVYQHSKNLTQHIRSFHEGRGFTCQQCCKQLSTKQKLKLHMEIVHNKETCSAKPSISDPDRVNRNKLLEMLGSDVNFDVMRPGPCKGVSATKRKAIGDNACPPQMRNEKEPKLDYIDLQAALPEPYLVPVSLM